MVLGGFCEDRQFFLIDWVNEPPCSGSSGGGESSVLVFCA